MGRDKALLRIDGMSWIDHTAHRLQAVCDEVVIADRGRQSCEGRPSLNDGPGRGPAAGILGAAQAFPRHDLLVLACDLPAVPVDLLRYLTMVSGADLVIPNGRRGAEPLCALYRQRALRVLAQRVADGRFALHPLASRHSSTPQPSTAETTEAEDREIQRLTVHRIEDSDLAPWGSPQALFANLNTPEDLERFLRRSS